MRERGAAGGGGGGERVGGNRRGRCFPLDRLLRMHDESSQTHELTRRQRGGDVTCRGRFSPRLTEGQTVSRGPVKMEGEEALETGGKAEAFAVQA